MTQFAVIQTLFERLPMETLIDVLIEQGGMTHADACRVSRRSHGILGEEFEEEQAEAVCKELTRKDFGVRVVPGDELPALPEPRIIRWFELDKETFRIPDGIRGETIAMDWTSVFVINVGQVADVKKKLMGDRRGPANLFEKNAAFFSDDGPKYREQGKLVEVVDVIGLDETGSVRYLRMPSTELAYSRIMGEGTQLTRFERFLVIVEFLVTHAEEAIVSPETRKVLHHREASQHLIEGDGMRMLHEQTLETYNRWLLVQAMVREQQIENSSDAIE